MAPSAPSISCISGDREPSPCAPPPPLQRCSLIWSSTRLPRINRQRWYRSKLSSSPMARIPYFDLILQIQVPEVAEVLGHVGQLLGGEPGLDRPRDRRPCPPDPGEDRADRPRLPQRKAT